MTTFIRAKQKETAHTAFLHKTRHDIHNAMHVVTGMSKVLELSDGIAPADREKVEMIRRNADLALELIDSLFDRMDEAEEPAQEFAASGKKIHALLVEDHVPNILIADAFLRELGYTFDIAKSGEEALKKFSAGHYDVIIMDVQMPGMDGLEATRQIRALEKRRDMKPTPILGTTGNATEDDKLFCTKAGMNDYISKPFGLEDLEKKLQGVIQAAGQ